MIDSCGSVHCSRSVNCVDPINLTIYWNNKTFNHLLKYKRFNQKHCHVSYCKQLPCGEMLSVIYFVKINRF